MDNKLSQPYWDRISLFGNLEEGRLIYILMSYSWPILLHKPFSETRLLDIRFLNIFKGKIATGK